MALHRGKLKAFSRINRKVCFFCLFVEVNILIGPLSGLIVIAAPFQSTTTCTESSGHCRTTSEIQCSVTINSHG